MKVTSLEAHNFGSYKHLKLDLTNLGLTLVSGPTGSGKSTLMDVVPWGLFGCTAKNGAADEIRAWASPNPTVVQLYLTTPQGTLEVTRQRGKINDFFYIKNGETIRGKDLTDTQKRLNNELGLDIDTYLAGAYFHEFSSTAAFFTASAKIRRQVIEQLVDLSFAVTMTKSSSEYKKIIKTAREDVQKRLIGLNSQAGTLALQISTNTKRSEDWQLKHTRKISELERADRDFEAVTKQRLETKLRKLDNEYNDLKTETDEIFDRNEPLTGLRRQLDSIDKELESLGDSKCVTCGNTYHSDHRLLLTRERHKISSEVSAIEKGEIRLVEIGVEMQEIEISKEELKAETPVNEHKSKLSHLQQENDPYTQVVDQLKLDLKQVQTDLTELQIEYDELNIEYDDVETLIELTDTLRAALVKNTIVEIQAATNKALTKYFNAEIKVIFEMSEADKIEVTIFKDGNTCTYSQLSKGQRQMLKLSFGIAVMDIVNNRNPASFNTVFLDEPTDGLDENLKIKAYGLLESLTAKHESVLVVEHSEALKSMFHNRLDVSLVNGHSQID